MTDSKNSRNHERLLETLRALSAESDSQAILQSTVSVARELTNSEIASILKYDEADEHLHFVATPFFHRETIQNVRVPLEESIAGWVYQNARKLVIQDVQKDQRFYSAVDQKANFQTHSILAIPLLVKGKPVGVLEAINKTSRAHYNGEDVFILETLASHIALIVENMTLAQNVSQMQAATDHLDQMKKDFIAIASHELRTPLGLILGHATFLREVVPENHYEQLDIIIKNGGKLKTIIENLSNIENFQSGAARIRMARFSLPELVAKTTQSFQPKAKEKKIDLSLDTEGADFFIEGDEEKIEIAIRNLLKNALSFTAEDGHILVTVEKGQNYVKFTIIDNGIGIPNEDLSQVFERFYQVESHLTRQHGGMGLGLSVAKVMIELHGGKIWAENMPEKGSLFAFLLPLDRDKTNDVHTFFQP